jgi:hypothetical protein
MLKSRAMSETIPTVEEVRALLAKRPRNITYEKIAKASNCSVDWLKQFAAGKVGENSSYQRIVAVYTYLNSVH